jgi:C1A family cysteine protease
MTLPLSPSGRRYGYLRKPHSHRAFGLASVPNLKLIALPPADHHLELWMPPVKDQGNLGACTAFAGTEDREAIARQFEKSSPILAPLFLYYVERQIDGDVDQGDTGSTGETSCKAQQQFGICEESVDPYDTFNFNRTPTAAQLAAASKWKNGAYHSIFTVEDIKTCILSGYRVRIGFNVYDSFENDIKSDGLMPMPDPNKEQLLGGHEVLGWAYDDKMKCPNTSYPGAFRIRNSWGSSWGLSGDFWMPYEAFASAVLAADAKVQHLGPAWVPRAD